MPAWVQTILDWVAANPESAGIAIFIISAVESLALVGILIPGVVILFAFGTLVGAGILPVVPVLLWAFAGAVLGDQLSFWLGWNLKERLWQIWPLSRYPQFVGKSERFFNKYGAASVFIGRFIGPIRPIIPAMAGMSNMPPLRFTLVNLSSAALWSPAYMLPGAVLGASMQVAGTVAAKMALLMMLVAAISYLIVWGSSHALIKIPAVASGICVTLFSTALIGVVLALVLSSSNAQLACDQYEQAAQSPQQLAYTTVFQQGGTAPSEALDIRYEGSLQALVERAGAAGLIIVQPAKPADYLRWLLPSPTLVELPARLSLHCYARTELILQSLNDDNLTGWELRFWAQEGTQNYWLGQVSRISVASVGGMISWPQEQAVPANEIDWPINFKPSAAHHNWQF